MIQTNIDERGIATIWMAREDVHNAFDEELIEKITTAFLEMDKEKAAKVICLRGRGKSFSAGADLNWMAKMAQYSWEENYHDSLKLASLMSTIANCQKPTMAFVHGATFGGGVGLVASCDFALASEKAIFCLSEVKLGLIPAVISPYVVKAIGVRAANQYFISAERFNADTALRLGLVNKVSSEKDFEDDIEKLLENIALNAPVAILEAKKLIKRVNQPSINEDMIRDTAQKIADRRASTEGREGVAAFLEKRAPIWPQETTNVEDITDGDGDV